MKELEVVFLVDKVVIEKVVNFVYINFLKYCGFFIFVFEDLMRKSDVIFDIIGFLMVKEIFNFEF